jgi:pyruvate/2-oxoglutarate dehydrogenase complex dihydrolipoamide dehydrogenase (E3) component
MARSKDAIIIGAGQSGPFLAARLAGEGWTVALIERAELGGTCVNNGCTPTKALIASARAAHIARRASDFGINTGPVTVDFKAVKARKDRIVAAGVKGLEDWLGGMENVEIVCGEARFVGPREVAVGDDRLNASKIFINAGCRPVVPDWPGINRVLYLTSESMMDLDVLPEHLVIVGGSYVGLEFGQMYRRFGSRVTIIEKGERIVSREDPDVSDAVRDFLAEEGIDFVVGARDFSLRQTDKGISLHLHSSDHPTTIEGSHLLVAIGRQPNTENLDLEAAGIAVDKRGYIAVNERLETSISGVYALGDINGHGAFTHTSYNDFEIVADNLLKGTDRSVNDRIPAYALYTDPPLGRVGLNQAQARMSGRRVLVATHPMARVGRAKERGETAGFLKVLVDAETRLVLGASLLGIEADEMIHAVIDIMAGKVTADTIAGTMHIHPTISEYLPELMKKLKPLGDQA